MVGQQYLLCLPNEIIHIIAGATSIQTCASLSRCSRRLADICIPILYRRDVKQRSSTAVSKTILLLYSYSDYPEDILANATEFDLTKRKDHVWAACVVTCSLRLKYREHAEILIRLLGGGALERISEHKIAEACEAMRRLRRLRQLSTQCLGDFEALIRTSSPRCSKKSWPRLANAVIRLLYDDGERVHILNSVIRKARAAQADLSAVHNENTGWLSHHHLPQYNVAGCSSTVWPPPLTMAMGYGLLDTVKLLSETEPLLSYSDNQCFPYATVVVPCVLGDLAMLRYLRKEKVRFEIEGSTVLHFAASREQMQMVKALVKKVGIDINSEDSNGYTPFMCYLMGVDENEADEPDSLARENIATFKKLGADIHRLDGTERSAVCIAFAFGKFNHVAALIAAGSKREDLETLEEAFERSYSDYLRLRRFWPAEATTAQAARMMFSLCTIRDHDTRELFSYFGKELLEGFGYCPALQSHHFQHGLGQ